jgi:hypothetical protein
LVQFLGSVVFSSRQEQAQQNVILRFAYIRNFIVIREIARLDETGGLL